MIRNILLVSLILILTFCACRTGEDKPPQETPKIVNVPTDVQENPPMMTEPIDGPRGEEIVISAEELVTRSMQQIKIGLERYASSEIKDSRRTQDTPVREYPGEISELVGTRYLKEYPTNAYTSEPLKIIEFGSKPFAGECTYIPVRSDGKVHGYYLFCYGKEDYEGLDVDGDGAGDHVLMVVDSGNELPPLEELLR